MLSKRLNMSVSRGFPLLIVSCLLCFHNRSAGWWVLVLYLKVYKFAHLCEIGTSRSHSNRKHAQHLSRYHDGVCQFHRNAQNGKRSILEPKTENSEMSSNIGKLPLLLQKCRAFHGLLTSARHRFCGLEIVYFAVFFSFSCSIKSGLYSIDVEVGGVCRLCMLQDAPSLPSSPDRPT